jgi:DNA-binding transcriptional LysR family regulator
VVTSDYLASVFLPPLMELLGAEAPGIHLDLRALDERKLPEQLESGAVDLGVLVFPNPAPALRQQRLFQEGFACLVRQDHPQVKHRLELEQFLRLPHALISPRGEGEGIVDRVLAQQGLSRTITLRLPFFLAAPLAISHSDLVLTAPRRLAESLAQLWPLQVLEPPLALPPFDAVQLWHERYEDEPAHRWLRGALSRATAPVR